MMEARHLRVLRAVARGGSFSAAARALGCTQPAVSQQVKALEAAAGTPLVVRSARQTRLTEAGEALVRHADGILAGLAAAEEEVAAIAGLRAGRVRLVSFPSGTSTLVPGAVAELRAAYPGTEVSLVEAQPPRSVEMLRAGDCDVVLAFRYEEEDWADLVVHPLLADPLLAVVPEAHPLAGAPAPADLADLADLAAERWIAGCPRCRGHLVELCARSGFTPRIDFATDDYPAVIGLVASGLGVTVLPALALEAVRTRGVRLLPLTPGVSREVVALTLPDLAHVPAVDMMLGRLVRAARRHGG